MERYRGRRYQGQVDDGSRDDTSSRFVLEILIVVLECQRETEETKGAGKDAKIEADAEIGDGEKAVKKID